MSESFAKFTRRLKYKPSIADLEKYCFDARTKGASCDTMIEVYTSGYSQSSGLSQFTVTIPEAEAIVTYSDVKPSSPVKNGLPVVAILFVLGAFLFFLGMVL